jgi:hypothetical protein
MPDATRRGRSFAEMAGVAFGVVYVLVGLAGFAVTSGVGFADSDGKEFLGVFEVNPLHNAVHLLVGAALLWGGTMGVEAARGVDTTVGALFLLVGVTGLFVGGTDADVLALNGTDHVLHLGSAGVLLAAGLAGARADVVSTSTSRTRARSRG